VNIFYNWFVSRIDTLIMDMEKGAQAVLDLIWNAEARKRAEAQGAGQA